MDPRLADDDMMLAALREEAAERHGPPPLFAAVAKASFDLRHLDADLATLVEDSALIESGTRRDVRRAGATSRTCTYAVGEGTLEIHIDERAVAGHVAGEVVAALVLATPGRERTVPVDEHGSFAIRPIPDGPFLLRIDFGDGRAPTSTEWLTGA